VASPVPVTVAAPTYQEPLPEFSLLASSEEQGWDGLLIHQYRLPPQLDPVSAPVTSAHKLAMVMRGSGNQRTMPEGVAIRPRFSAGRLNLIPATAPSAYTWDALFEVAHFYLDPSVVMVAAAATCRGDPDRVELHPMLDFRDPFVEQLCRLLLTQLQERSPSGRLYADALTQALALHLLRCSSSLIATPIPQPHRLSPPQLRLVTDYIHDHSARDISLNELASVVHLSPAYFARQFKLAQGSPPHQYLIHCRIERARALLLDSALSIAQIAQLVGFADHAHLTRHFKRLTGRLPSDLRRAAQIARGKKSAVMFKP
jgi:AraC family transcriptional regulator